MTAPSHSTPAELFDLTGLHAVVVGGTGVLCGAMADGLAAAGASVVVVGRNAEKGAARVQAITEAGGSARFVAAEATSRDDLTRLRDDVLGTEGRIDILVNGAGANAATPFLEISDEEFLRLVDINIGSVIRGCQILGAPMLDQQGGGAVINVGSLSAHNPLSRVFTYSATKAAVHNLSGNLAREWAPHGVRVNTLVPGFFPAEQNRKVLDKSRVDSILGGTPMGRFGEPGELIGATLLMASPKAGSFLTGAEIVVDGGFETFTL